MYAIYGNMDPINIPQSFFCIFLPAPAGSVMGIGLVLSGKLEPINVTKGIFLWSNPWIPGLRFSLLKQSIDRGDVGKTIGIHSITLPESYSLEEVQRKFLVGGLEHGLLFSIYPFHIWDVTLPIDEVHHFSRWLLHHQPDSCWTFFGRHKQSDRKVPFWDCERPVLRSFLDPLATRNAALSSFIWGEKMFFLLDLHTYLLVPWSSLVKME